MVEKIRRYMQGRYGMDELSKFLMAISIVMLLLATFTSNSIVNLVSFIIIGFVYVRMFSKNFYKCSIQNQKYLKLRNKITGSWQNKASHFKQRKTHNIYSCPECKQKVRIPKGKGKVKITCPKCKAEFSEIS